MIDKNRLAEKCSTWNISLSPAQLDQLDHYAEILVSYNEKVNLTAITSPEGIEDRHFADSLLFAAQPEVQGKMVDVGTGAGFPGMPMAILEPTARLTLLDSLGKRIDFLQETAEALKLENVTCIHARAEEFAADHRERYDYAVSRAVAALPVLSELALPLVKPGGAFLAMKSVDSDAEIDSARSAIGQLGGKIEKLLDYTVPCTEVRHRVVLIRKVKPTPRQFPRAFARIKKTPLK